MSTNRNPLTLRQRLDPRLWLQYSQDLLERKINSDLDEVVLKQSGYWTKSITWVLMGGTAFGLIWLATAKTEEIVVATGKLEPISRVVDVQMPLQGIAKSILVKEGQRVKKGQVLIQLDTEASKDRYDASRESVSLKQAELMFKLQELQNTKRVSDTRIENLRQSLTLAKKVEGRLQSLVKEGAAGELQYLEQRNKVQQLEGDIRQTMAERKRQESILQQNIRSLKAALSELGSRRTESNVILRYQEILAPVDGMVFDLKPRSSGFVAQSSEPILKIVPGDNLQARVEIDSRQIGFVSIGAPADISIDSYPSSDFGVIGGRITRISSDALPPDPTLNKDARFPADIRLDSQVLQLRNGRRLPLQVGMSLTANIKLRKVTYLQLLMSSFRDKADSLRRL